jgi:hypothetical protein
MVFKCDSVVEVPWIKEYVQTRWIEKQYIKAKAYLIEGKFVEIDFHKRKPTTNDIYYFKINKKYRAIWYLDWPTFKVVEISDHQ